MAMKMWFVVFLIVTLCSLVGDYQCFRGIYNLPEDGGSIFFKMFIATYKTVMSNQQDKNQYLNKVHMVPLLDMMDKRKFWH